MAATTSARDILKRAARPLVRVGGEPVAAALERRLRRSARQAGVAIAYHSLADRSGDPATELVPPHAVTLYEAELRHLARRYRVVPAAELQQAAAARQPGERFPVAVTFDDDLDSHVRRALPVLRRLDLPATFFVSGASLEEPQSFWWERLQRAFDTGAEIPEPAADSPPGRLEPHEIRRVGAAVEALDPPARERWSRRLLEAAGPDPPDAGLRAAGVRALAEAGMTLGFHTLRHDPLPTLGDDELPAALRGGRDELERLAGAPIDVVGYPHGRADARIAAAARAAGFTVGFVTGEKAVTPHDDALLLGRLNPSYRSVGHFALQLVQALATAHR